MVEKCNKEDDSYKLATNGNGSFGRELWRPTFSSGQKQAEKVEEVGPLFY